MLRIKNNKIKELLDQGVEISEIAKTLRVTTRTIYNIINNKNNPSLPLAKSIANFFKKDIDHLFEFEEE